MYIHDIAMVYICVCILRYICIYVYVCYLYICIYRYIGYRCGYLLRDSAVSVFAWYQEKDKNAILARDISGSRVTPLACPEPSPGPTRAGQRARWHNSATGIWLYAYIEIYMGYRYGYLRDESWVPALAWHWYLSHGARYSGKIPREGQERHMALCAVRARYQ